MDKDTYSSLYFENYYIDKIEFKLNNDFENAEIEIDFDIEVDLNFSEEKNEGIVILKLTLWDKPQNNNYPFKLVVSIIGKFLSDEEMSKKEFENMCKYSGTATLFPFLRSTVSEITRSSNFGPPVILPLINVNKLIKEKESET